MTVEFFCQIKGLWISDIKNGGRLADIFLLWLQRGEGTLVKISSMLSTRPAQAHIATDAIEPECKVVRRAKMSQILPGGDERFLYDIPYYIRRHTIASGKVCQARFGSLEEIFEIVCESRVRVPCRSILFCIIFIIHR